MQTLAHNLVCYSCKVQPGEHVLIENTGIERDMVCALIDEVYAAGGYPHVHLRDSAVLRSLLMNASTPMLDVWAENDAALMKKMQCYIGLRAGDNSFETSDVPAECMQQYSKEYGHVVHTTVRLQTRWVVLRYPTPSMAQKANISTSAFEDFYFQVCNLNYQKMGEAMAHLVERMQRTDRVRLVSPGTDLTFSIKGIPAIPCAGELNIPDGEVFTAPVRDSVNGRLAYNTPTSYNGTLYNDVVLEFKDGKIISATSNHTEQINHVFDTDEGARYVGEFAIGVNPYILHPMGDTLFDEKIAGSIHFTPGNCYDEAPNGNQSAIHWDMVLIQRPEYGGGEMYFDDELVRKDGLFLPAELQCLNPDALK